MSMIDILRINVPTKLILYFGLDIELIIRVIFEVNIKLLKY